MVRDNNENFDESNEPRVNIVSQVVSVVFFLASIYVVYRLIAIGSISTLYIIGVAALLVFINFILGLVAFRRKTSIITLIIINVVSIILAAGMIFSVITYFDNRAVDDISNNDEEGYIIYNIITSNKSNVNTTEELDGKELFIYNEPEKKVDDKDLENAIANVISDSTVTYKGDIEIITNRTIKLIDSASVINNDTYESYISNNPDCSEKIKIIKKIKIKSKDTL